MDSLSKNKLTPWQRLMGLLELEKKDILQVCYYAIFNGIVTLSLPLGVQAIINLIQGAQISTSWIILVVLVTAGVGFSGALQLMQFRVIETLQQRIFIRSSFDLSYRFPKLKMNAIRGYYPSELANRFFEILTIQKGVSKILVDVPSALLNIIFAIILLSLYHPFFIVFGLLLIILITILFKYTAKKGLATSLEESKYKYKIAHWIQEIARSLISFKLSGKTDLEMKKNDSLMLKYLDAREKHFKILMLQFIKMISFKVIVTASLLLIGGMLVLNQEMNIGQFVAAEIIIILVINSAEKLIVSLEMFYDVLTSLEKLGQVVDLAIEAETGEKLDNTHPLHIVLDEVSYSVSERKKPIINNVSLDIQPRSRIVISGESGSGKSSLLRLVSGLIKPTSGNVLVNGLSIEALQLNEYRSMLGMALSEETPFEGTLRENICFGNAAITDTEIYDVMEKVGMSGFLKDLPNGLSTVINPEGRKLSFTMNKKILLARAIIKKPAVLILEDPLDQFNPKVAEDIINYITDKSHSWSLLILSNNKKWDAYCTQKIILSKGAIQMN